MAVGSLMLVTGVSSALAQSRQCVALRQRIFALEHQGPGDAGRLREMAARQQQQIERTSAYANSIGCSNRKFLFFGKNPPPQCGALNARISQMRIDLSNIMERLGAGGGNNRVEVGALRGQYAALCLGQPAPTPTQNGPGGLLNALFGHHQAPFNQPGNDGASSDNAIPARGASDDGTQLPPVIDNPAGPASSGRHLSGGSMAICVRECDGGFFPVSYSAWHHSVAALQQLCTARCPNAAVELYSMAVGADIGTARSANGQSYQDLPNAFLFRKTHVQGCGCKPPGESWAQALAKSDAETLLGHEDANDIIVTQQQSVRMGQPKLAGTPALQLKGGQMPVAARPRHAVSQRRAPLPLRHDGGITSAPLPPP
ncbi:MAG: DUF2865 domain-containing protein [Hyphomicrobiales bacterium]|nr:DUF2865 domain-containing protein [Hyphomicrobiales bacterium]